MGDPLIEYLRSCCVQVAGERPGCGFFISERLVITCAHVVGREIREGTEVELRQWKKDKIRTLKPPAFVKKILPYDDLALLQTTKPNRDFALLSENTKLNDPLARILHQKSGGICSNPL